VNIVDFLKAKWIWTEDNKSKDQKIVLRKKFRIDSVPEHAYMYVACDTKFWLWINGKLVVYEGGVFRESKPGCGYAEKIDVAEYLAKGENILAVLVWYYGNAGRNNVDSGEAGFILKCDELELYSDASFLAKTHPAYVKTGAPYPSYLFGGENIGFDARLDFGDFTVYEFDDADFEPATEYQNKVWGECVQSPLPLLRLYEEKELAYELTVQEIKDDKQDADSDQPASGNIKSKTVIATAGLPYAMTLSVCFELEADGNEIVDIRTDRYAINGGPGDEGSCYNGHRIEYTCVPGNNVYKCPMYLYGEKVIMSFPETVRLKRLSYIESGYDTEQIGSIKTDNELFNQLIEKCIRTLYVCMRNNFMDCPDRERGQWIGDVSVQAPQVAFVYDEKAMKLVKNAICDFIYLRKGDILVGNVPGIHYSELPSQSLVAISEFGLVGEYYASTRDSEIPNLVLEPMVNYLKLWELGEQGLLIPRSGDWRWFDHLWNVDEDVIENCMYVAAAKYALKMAELAGRHEFDDFLKNRIETISANVEKHYWKTLGRDGYYSSGKLVDERANAIAVMAGICPKERYGNIRKILLTVFNSTPYMERFVLVALCEMGYVEDAYKRMMARYYNLTVNENSTLWEDFYILGTRNHAWSGAPLEIVFKYILGLRIDNTESTYTINPVPGIFKEIHCSFPVNGKKVEIHL